MSLNAGLFKWQSQFSLVLMHNADHMITVVVLCLAHLVLR